jgi:hypothetical protein
VNVHPARIEPGGLNGPRAGCNELAILLQAHFAPPSGHTAVPSNLR